MCFETKTQEDVHAWVYLMRLRGMVFRAKTCVHLWVSLTRVLTWSVRVTMQSVR